MFQSLSSLFVCAEWSTFLQKTTYVIWDRIHEKKNLVFTEMNENMKTVFWREKMCNLKLADRLVDLLAMKKKIAKTTLHHMC